MTQQRIITDFKYDYPNRRGALIGATVFYIFSLIYSNLLGSPRSIIPGLRELVSGALLGSLVAISFGLIAGFPLFRSETR
jgi:hypothetical protein